MRMRRSMVRHAIAVAVVVLGWQPLSAQPEVSVRPLDSTASAVTLYTVSFVLPDTLHPDGEIVLDFPAGFGLGHVEIAGSSSITGGLDVSVEGQRVRIRRKGRGDVYSPGSRVDVKFATVANPEQARDDYEVVVSLRRGQTLLADNLRGRVAIVAKP